MARQVNPSSDNDRSGGGAEPEQETHDQQPRHQTNKAAEPRVQMFPSPPQQETENQDPHFSNSDIPEEQVSQLQSNPADAPQLGSNHAHLRPEGVFVGSELVGWLVERGLCAGRAEAQVYGTRLQQGGVLGHVTGECSFRDDPTLLYHFTGGGCPRGWRFFRNNQK